MVTEFSYDGSPLIPGWFISLYLCIYFFLLFIILTLINKKKTKKKKSFSWKRIFLTAIFLKLSLMVFILLSALYCLFPDPKLIKTNLPETKIIHDLDEKIEIVFDRPVRRKELVKTLTPYAPGIFIFENPIYDTHLYRKLVFYPKFPLQNEQKYVLNLSNIKNFLSFSRGKSYQIAFQTQAKPDVLGVQKNDSDEVKITGTFPERGWIQVAADIPVKIAFNKAVDHQSAQSRFSINPEISGRFSWENNTLIIIPDRNFSFNTIYTVKISPGVEGLDGTRLQEEYIFYFAIQEEIFRLKIPALYQKYTLSCEIASLRMALMYRGIDVSEDQLLTDVGFDPAGKDGDNWGNPYVGFVGNVKGSQMVNGYGVFWDPIARAANKYRYAKTFENWSITHLTDSIQKNTPVIVWIACKNGRQVEWLAPSGDKIKTVADEHAVLAIGFRGTKNDPSHIIINDPLIGENYLETETFSRKWSIFQNSGVLVY